MAGTNPTRRLSTSRIDLSFSLGGFHALLAPQRGAFQLSLTVLVCYRLPAFIFSLRWPAPPIFSQHFQAGLLTGQALSDPACQVACNALCSRNSACVLQTFTSRTQPLDYRSTTPARGEGIRSRANPFSLAATTGISIDFFSSAD